TSSEATVTAALAVVNGAAADATTFNLTTVVDNITATTKDDIVNGFVDASAATTSTFTAADVIAGGSGMDVINLTASGTAANALPASSITDVESFSIRDVATVAGAYNFALVSGETSVTSNASTNGAGVGFTNLATGTALTIKGDGTSTLANHTATMQSASSPMNITFDNGTKGAFTFTRAQTGATSLTINSTGAANTTGVLDFDTGTAIKTVTVNAAANLTATLAADFAANTAFTVSGAATLVDLDAATLSANVKTFDASGLTAGGARIAVDQTVAVLDTMFKGGAGD
ncbi:unnamed protein product, partial [Scytosiphon promiscuus]